MGIIHSVMRNHFQFKPFNAVQVISIQAGRAGIGMPGLQEIFCQFQCIGTVS
jgi:hypothetical protein